VISVNGVSITIKDYLREDDPFTVALDEVTPDTPGPKREKKKKAK
jgi:riboflavin synthase alpha subunit